MIWTDRSRIETWQTCPRKRWWGYEANRDAGHVGGWEPVRLSAALETGTALHHVRELALTTGVAASPDGAIRVVLSEYQQKVADEWAALDALMLPRSTGWEEQYDLVEALSRVWFAVALPRLLDAYEVVSVEREYPARFAYAGENITLMTRPDLVLRRKVDGALFVHNLKTAAECDSKWREQWRYDQQTLTEAIAVEQCMGEPVGGVIVGGLVKGRRSEWEFTEGVKTRIHNNPLVWAWMYDDGLTEPSFEPNWKYTCVEPHDRCPGGRNHTLGRGWTKVRVAERYAGGIKAWVEHLLERQPQLVESFVVECEPILRSEYEIERWKRQALTQDVDVAAAADLCRPRDGEDEQERVLDECFPMHTAHGNCTNQYGGKCEFFDICWGVVAGEPGESGLFRARVANHPQEGHA